MSTRSVRARHYLILSLVAATALIVVSASTVQASASPSPPSIQYTADWSWGSVKAQLETWVHNSFRSRARIIQVSAVAVALGLFIMFRSRKT